LQSAGNVGNAGIETGSAADAPELCEIAGVLERPLTVDDAVEVYSVTV
jgi:hypothetical protein